MKTIANITYFTLALIALSCLTLARALEAVEPPPDGGYPNNNTAEGEDALFSLTTGGDNTAMGHHALFNLTTGSANTAMGHDALRLTTANDNTAMGWAALLLDSTGFGNTAVGIAALFTNQTGSLNTAIGANAIVNNISGANNTVLGVETLFRNQTGSNNIAVGYSAGYAVRGSNNIEIGNRGVPDDANHIRIGTTGVHLHTTVAGIYGVFGGDGIPVLVNSNGRLGTATSSARFKEAIEPMANSSEAILSLKPVSFRYKKELDSEGAPQFGLVAEEVEKVAPELVSHDEQGKPYTVRYEAVNAMLLNEFLKEHRKNEQQRKDFVATIARQQKQIDALAAGLQRVSAELDINKRETKTVLNNR